VDPALAPSLLPEANLLSHAFHPTIARTIPGSPTVVVVDSVPVLVAFLPLSVVVAAVASGVNAVPVLEPARVHTFVNPLSIAEEIDSEPVHLSILKLSD
jgi:hypothetical protein